MTDLFMLDIESFVLKVDRRKADIFQRLVELVLESIVRGSSVTGSPGQPVDTGALRNSWQLVLENEFEAAVITGLAYAPSIEEGKGRGGDITLRSAVGGFHSVKLTRAAFNRLVRRATRDVLLGAA